MEDGQYTEPLATISSRLRSRGHALYEMSAFIIQRLLLIEIDWLSICLIRCWNVVFPINGVRIQQQLILSFRIIKHRHFTVTYNDKFLFFERMQPGYENMCLHPAGK